jgi:hypothetical protein
VWWAAQQTAHRRVDVDSQSAVVEMPDTLFGIFKELFPLQKDGMRAIELGP